MSAPDLFELQDWCVLNRPDVWAAVKYLHADTLYAAILPIWLIAEEVQS